MNMRQMSLLVLGGSILVAGCGDRRDPLSPSAATPSSVISDGRFVGGNPDFFFLPPMLPDPKQDPNFDAGAFNAFLGPTVRVCQLAADPSKDPATDCALDANNAPILVASFSSSDVQVSTSDEAYHVNWHTDESNLDVGLFYRVQVHVGSTLLGFADFDPINNARELKNLRTGEVIPLVDGRTLPVRFRIEHGALCDNDADCGEFLVTSDGGTFQTNTGFAGIQFKPGFLPDGVEEITLTIERVTVGSTPGTSCHLELSSQLWREFEGCYRYTTDPDLQPFGGIQRSAIVAKCSTLPETDPLWGLQQGFKSRPPSPDEPRVLVRLPNLIPPPELQLDCTGFLPSVASSQSSSPLLRLASAAVRPVTTGLSWMFGIRPLHAVDLGLGDLLEPGSALSNINWGIALEAQGVDTDLTLDSNLEAELQVVVTATHVHSTDPDAEDSNGGAQVDEHLHAMAGVPVEFSIASGGSGHFLDAAGAPTQSIIVMTPAGSGLLDPARGIASVTFVGSQVSSPTIVAATLPTFDQQPIQFTISPPALAASVTINFDTDPNGAAVAAGTVVNSVYASQGVTLRKIPAGSALCGTDDQVYANSHGPVNGGFGFNSGQNSVTVCPEGVASDFTETNFGVIEAQLSADASSVCIDVAPTTSGGFGFIEALDATGQLLARTESAPDARATICASASGIRVVRFAGAGLLFAIFDNLLVQYGVPPIR